MIKAIVPANLPETTKVQCPYNYSLQQNLLQAMVLSQLTKPLLRHVVQVSLQITTHTSST